MSQTHETPEEIGLIEVVKVSDDSGHDYLLPKEKEEEFDRLLELSTQEPESYEDEFIKQFDQYRVEGEYIALYARLEDVG